MKIAIVVLSYNSRKYISKCLRSLQTLQTNGYEVKKIVVDNASQDATASYLQKDFPDFELIVNPQNLGYAAGNNVGIKSALEEGADWVWIVNPDVDVDKKSLIELINFGVSHPQAGILGSKVYFAPGFEFHKVRYKKSDTGKVLWFAGGKMDWDNVASVHIGMNEVDTGKYDQVAEVGFLTGSSVLIKADVIKKIGLLDPKYFLYFEETDFCQRAKRAGFKLMYVPQSQVWHANAQATGVGSALVDYYTTRNRLLFGMRWAPGRAKIALIRESIRLFFSGRPGQKKGVTDFYLGKFGKGSYVN